MTFSALVLDLEAEKADRLSDTLLAAGALSVTCEDALAGTASETACFDEPLESAAWPRVRLTALCRAQDDPAQLLRHACGAARLPVPRHRLHQVAEEDWVARCREQFVPIRVSARLWIVPTWHAAPDPGAINLLIDPGLAFGTGSHPTTRLCLQWLDRVISGGETVLDYGCGSGILAIAALKLGARRAAGVDIDAQALSVARDNARRNGVDCEFLDSRKPLTLAANVVVANILANPLKLLAPALASLCARGGRLALSGILPAQADEIMRHYSPWMAFEPAAEEGGWVCLSGTRR
ncbi:MAG: 50S ribosomal protein L11 methyltransferase [Burkholderiales bacterium]